MYKASVFDDGDQDDDHNSVRASHLNSGGTRQQALGEGARAGGGPRNNSALVGELAEEPLPPQACWSRHRCVLGLDVPAINKERVSFGSQPGGWCITQDGCHTAAAAGVLRAIPQVQPIKPLLQ